MIAYPIELPTRLTLSVTGSTHHGVAVELIEGYLNQVNARVKLGQDGDRGGIVRRAAET